MRFSELTEFLSVQCDVLHKANDFFFYPATFLFPIHFMSTIIYSCPSDKTETASHSLVFVLIIFFFIVGNFILPEL